MEDEEKKKAEEEEEKKEYRSGWWEQQQERLAVRAIHPRFLRRKLARTSAPSREGSSRCVSAVALTLDSSFIPGTFSTPGILTFVSAHLPRLQEGC